MGRVLVVGTLQLIILTDVDQLPGPGETATSLRTRRAVGGRGVDHALAARTAGAEVVMIGAVGDDDAGRWCAGALFDAGIETRLEVVGHQPTGLAVTARDGLGATATVVVPGANEAVSPEGAGLDDLAPGDVLLTHSDGPGHVVAAGVRRASAREARVVVNASPYAALPGDVVAIADPFVVGERDASVLADTGVIPESFCVTFGTAGAVWNGLRINGTGSGRMPQAPTATQVDAFCGTLAAALAAGQDEPSALRLAIAAASQRVDA